MVDVQILQSRLVEAENALHQLQIGGGIASVTDQNGDSVRYTVARRSELQAYIAQLKSQIAEALGGQVAHRGPIRPVFR